MYFPDDKIGSRVLLTSRDIDMSIYMQRDWHMSCVYVLKLKVGTCFKRRWLIRMGMCPFWLEKFGIVINKKCEGLPFAIVIAG